jgi:hypothetical protein
MLRTHPLPQVVLTLSDNDFDFEAKALCYKIRYLTHPN